MFKKQIVLNWILYSSNKTYNYTTYNYIKNYVDKYYMEMVITCSYLYQRGDDSSRIVMAACSNKLREFTESINRKALNNGNYESSKEYYNDFKKYEEVFITDNVNKYVTNNETKKDSYLVSFLLKWLNGSNIYEKDSDIYSEFVKLIMNYPEEVLNALFIGSITSKKMMKKIVMAIKDKKQDEFVEKVKVLDRNARITYKEKYVILKNKFILALEDAVKKTYDDYEEIFFQSEEDECVRNWLNGVSNEIQNTLVNWWNRVSLYDINSKEYNLVLEYILNNYETFLESMFVMYILGININFAINSVAVKNKDVINQLINSYVFQGVNLGKNFINEENINEFLNMLNKNMKLERRMEK